MFPITADAKNLYSCPFEVFIIYRSGESTCTSPSSICVLTLPEYSADVHFLITCGVTICILALCLSLEEVGICGFDGFHNRPGSAVG